MKDNMIDDKLITSLLQWYDKEKRVLPWRENKDPYHIWISEIMLQQTRVEAVKPYYYRFLNAFKTVSDLADATDEQLLKYWEGLGYYSRVRNMKKAAVIIKNQYQGVMPRSYRELLALPGIGSYTAGAIASIAYGEAVPAVDGNVLRILSRVRMDERNISKQATRKDIEQELLPCLPGERTGDFNQALMDLGAMVCVPVGLPHCESCPLEKSCLAHRNACEPEFPQKDRKKPRKIEKYTVLILKDGRSLAVRKRKEKGLLAGMYEFPMFEGYLNRDEVVKKLKMMGLEAIRIKMLEKSKHVFTHKEWHMLGYAVYVDELAKMEGEYSEELLFIQPEETKDKYPIPSAFRAYARYINIKLGNEVFNLSDEE